MAPAQRGRVAGGTAHRLAALGQTEHQRGRAGLRGGRVRCSLWRNGGLRPGTQRELGRAGHVTVASWTRTRGGRVGQHAVRRWRGRGRQRLLVARRADMLRWRRAQPRVAPACRPAEGRHCETLVRGGRTAARAGHSRAHLVSRNPHVRGDHHHLRQAHWRVGFVRRVARAGAGRGDRSPAPAVGGVVRGSRACARGGAANGAPGMVAAARGPLVARAGGRLLGIPVPGDGTGSSRGRARGVERGRRAQSPAGSLRASDGHFSCCLSRSHDRRRRGRQPVPRGGSGARSPTRARCDGGRGRHSGLGRHRHRQGGGGSVDGPGPGQPRPELGRLRQVPRRFPHQVVRVAGRGNRLDRRGSLRPHPLGARQPQGGIEGLGHHGAVGVRCRVLHSRPSRAAQGVAGARRARGAGRVEHWSVLAKPRVLHHLSSREATLRVLHDEAPDQVARRRAHRLPLLLVEVPDGVAGAVLDGVHWQAPLGVEGMKAARRAHVAGTARSQAMSGNVVPPEG